MQVFKNIAMIVEKYNIMINVFKLFHKNENWIGLRFSKNEVLLSKLQHLSGFQYSKTNKCYYIPYSTESYTAFRSLNLSFKIDQIGTAETKISKSDKSNIEGDASNVVIPKNQVTDKDAAEKISMKEGPNIHWSGKFFIVKIEFKSEDVKFLKTLKGCYWNDKYKNWIVKSDVENLKMLQGKFTVWSEREYLKLYELISLQISPQLVELYLSPEKVKFVFVKLMGFGIDIAFIKTLAHREYDKEYKRWIIPLTKGVVEKIIGHYKNLGVTIVNRIPNVDTKEYYTHQKTVKERLKYLLSKFPSSFPQVLSDYADVMLVQNYGWRSIQAYTGKMAKFISYHQSVHINKLTAADVNAYLTYLTKQDVSESLVNMTLSAIKFYYNKVAYRDDFEIERLKRPKKGKYLPTILSEKEVDSLFRSIENLKHLCIAYTLYNGGIRLSELLKIRMQDIYWDRNQIILKGAKGNKDRMTPLSETLKAVLIRYVDEYKPEYWLYEGADKKRPYSRSSVGKVIKKAAEQGGVKREVTPHTLRHCFATHLLDHGTDIRYIQELLGHKDIKTTLIYTHVSNRDLGKIISPLDRLNKDISE